MGSLIVLGGIFLVGVVLTLVLSLCLMIFTKGRMPPADEGFGFSSQNRDAEISHRGFFDNFGKLR